LHLLTKSGAIAALIVGTAVFAGTGFRGSIALVGYFLTSSLLGRLPRAVAFTQHRGGQRDAVQVLANAGIPALLAVLHLAASAKRHPTLAVAYSSAVAAAAADTWATEIGGRYGTIPRSIVTGRPVTPGTSGGISHAGVYAAAAGSALIAAIAISNPSSPKSSNSRQFHFVAIFAAGITGSIIDSLAGALFQEVRFCQICSNSTERSVHDCGAETSRIRGVPGWNNDVTNVVGILSGMIVGIVLLKFRVRLCPTISEGGTRFPRS
jgi:uncharacterized protein (TIGR00297 family)